MNPDDIRKNIELKVVELLKYKLSTQAMTEERSKFISNTVLSLLQPNMDPTSLYKAIMKLDDACPELSSIVYPYAKQYEETITQQAALKVRDLIRVGKYDAAINLAKNVVNQDVKLSFGSSR